MSGTKGSAVAQFPLPRPSIRQMHQGVRLLAVVTSTTPECANVCLPFSLSGIIPKDAVADGGYRPDIQRLYRPGDYLPAVVSSVDSYGHIILSCAPSAFAQKASAKAATVVAQVLTQEDHGWTCTISDAQNTTCFLAKSRVPNALLTRLLPGFVVQAMVVESKASVSQLSLLEGDISSIAADFTLFNVMPGSFVRAEVQIIAPTNCTLRVLSKGSRASHAYMSTEHYRRSDTFTTDYQPHEGFKGKFRVVMYDSNPTILTMNDPLLMVSNLPHLMKGEYLPTPLPSLAPGSFLESMRVICASPAQIFTTPLPSANANAGIDPSVCANASAGTPPVILLTRRNINAKFTETDKLQYSFNEVITDKAKILFYKPFEALYHATIDKAAIHTPGVAELFPGQILDKATQVIVTAVSEDVAMVSIGNSKDPTQNVRGRLERLHYGSTLRREGVHIGQNLSKVKGLIRYLETTHPSGTVSITLANFGPEGEAFFMNKATVRVGDVSKGMVISFVDKQRTSALVKFFGGLKGMCFHGRSMSPGHVYNFICVSNSRDFLDLDRLESSTDDELLALRADRGAALARVMEYRPPTLATSPRIGLDKESTSQPSTDAVPMPLLLRPNEYSVTVSAVLSGGVVLTIQRLGGDSERLNELFSRTGFFLPGAFISSPAVLMDVSRSFAENGPGFSIFECLPHKELVIFSATDRGNEPRCLLVTTLQDVCMRVRQNTLPLTNSACLKNTVYTGYVSAARPAGIFVKFSEGTSMFLPTSILSKDAQYRPFDVAHIRVRNVVSKKSDEIRVEGRLVSPESGSHFLREEYVTRSGALLPETKGSSADSGRSKTYDEVLSLPLSQTHPISLPLTPVLNPKAANPQGFLDHHKARSVPVKARKLLVTDSVVVPSCIFDLGGGIIGRLTLTEALSCRAARLLEENYDVFAAAKELTMFMHAFADRDSGTMRFGALFSELLGKPSGKKASSADSEEIYAHLFVREILTLKGNNALALVDLGDTSAAIVSSCRVVDLSLAANHKAQDKLGSLFGLATAVGEDHILFEMFSPDGSIPLDSDYLAANPECREAILAYPAVSSAVDMSESLSDALAIPSAFQVGDVVPLSLLANEAFSANDVLSMCKFFSLKEPSIQTALFSCTLFGYCVVPLRDPASAGSSQKSEHLCMLARPRRLLIDRHGFPCVSALLSFVPRSDSFSLPKTAFVPLTRLSDECVPVSPEFLTQLPGIHRYVRLDTEHISIRPADVSGGVQQGSGSLLSLPTSYEDLEYARVYSGYVMPYRTLRHGVYVSVSESLSVHVKFSEANDEFMPREAIASKLPGYTFVRVKVIRKGAGPTDTDGTLRSSVVNNPDVRHPTEILAPGKVLTGRINNLSDSKGVFILVDNCYPKVTVRAGLVDALDRSIDGRGLSDTYRIGQRVYFVVLEVKDKGAAVGLKLSHFKITGCDPAKLPRLQQDKGFDETIGLAHKASDPHIKAIVDDVIHATSRAKKLDLFRAADQQPQPSQEQEAQHASLHSSDGSEESDNEGIIRFLDFSKALARTDAHDTDSSDSSTSDSSASSDNQSSDSDDCSACDQLKEYDRDDEHNRLTAQQKAAALEAETRRKEELILLDAAPQTAADYERLLAGTPESSHIWIRYMAMYVDRAQLDEARAVADNAVRKIPVAAEGERINVWLAKVALEERFSGPEAATALLKQAILRNDPDKLLLQYCAGKIKQGGYKEAMEGFELLLSKRERRRSLENWTAYLRLLYTRPDELIPDEFKAQARGTELKRALECLPEFLHVRLLCDIARMEYASGNYARGRTVFEGVVSNFPRRIDIWGQYLDAEEKNCAAERLSEVRSLYERVCSLSLSVKKMGYFFKRFYKFESKHGNSVTKERVRELAVQFAERSE